MTKLTTYDRIRRKIKVQFRKTTSTFRELPNFIIFGAPRCGTTSLYDHLVKHPSVVSALSKEVGYFEHDYHRGLKWYKMYFPLKIEKYKIKNPFREDFMTGEATTNYIHHPQVPNLIKKDLPNVKLIVMLRNPVDRAFSQFYKQVKQGRESLSFELAIKKEEERIKGETEKMLADSSYYGLNYHNYSYLTAGKYYDRLKLWFEKFPKEQIFVIKSEDFYKDPNYMYSKTLKFLNLKHWELKTYKKLNYFSDKPKIESSIEKKLSEYFLPHNEKLFKFLGRDFEWN